MSSINVTCALKNLELSLSTINLRQRKGFCRVPSLDTVRLESGPFRQAGSYAFVWWSTLWRTARGRIDDAGRTASGRERNVYSALAVVFLLSANFAIRNGLPVCALCSSAQNDHHRHYPSEICPFSTILRKLFYGFQFIPQLGRAWWRWSVLNN